MVRAWLFVDFAACRTLFRNPLGAEYSEKYHVSLLSILGHCFDVVFSGKTLHTQMLHLTQVKMGTWWGRDGNVYDKFNATRWLQDCVLYVEMKWHTSK